MRYHRIYKLTDPRYPLEHPRHIWYIGRTSTRKLPEELDWLSSEWPREGGPKWRLLQDMLDAGAEPEIGLLETVHSAREAEERLEHWVAYCEGQGYELINGELENCFPDWDRQRVVEDFQIEVMRLLEGEESPYEVGLRKLEEEGRKDSALYAYLQAAETPSNLTLEEIPALFQERDERTRGLEDRVMKAIGSGQIAQPLASALEEAIEEAQRATMAEEGSALDRYTEVVSTQWQE